MFLTNISVLTKMCLHSCFTDITDLLQLCDHRIGVEYIIWMHPHRRRDICPRLFLLVLLLTQIAVHTNKENPFFGLLSWHVL